MTELEKWERVNSVKTLEDLQKAIEKVAYSDGKITGSKGPLDAETQAKHAGSIYNGTLPLNYVTRTYGIRQQLMFIMHKDKRMIFKKPKSEDDFDM